MKRESLIIGNWKMYKTIAEAKEFVRRLRLLLKSFQKAYIAAPFTTISSLSEETKDSSIVIGAQNLHPHKEGAFTGEISGWMLREAGAAFVLVGHSERRQLFKESNQVIHEKLLAAYNFSLRPVVCIGETKEEREAGKTEGVLERQLYESLGEISLEQLNHLVLAYEPVWAIGTGLTATPDMAESTQAFCRRLIETKWGRAIAEKLPILYGGSVKVENSSSLLEQENIDGLLIGGASLDVDSFYQIITKN